MVRESGPPYHPAELWRLEQVGALAGNVLRQNESATSDLEVRPELGAVDARPETRRWGTMGVKTRIWATAAVVWVVLFLVLYLWQVNRDGNDPAWWYVVSWRWRPASSCRPRCRARPAPGPGPAGGLVILVVAALLGGFTVGPVLIPAIVGVVVALKAAPQQPAPPG